MAAPWGDSFNVQGTDAAVLASYAAGAGVTLVPGGGRDGNGCVEFPANAAGYLAHTVGSLNASAFVATGAMGAWFDIPSVPAVEMILLEFGGNAASGYAPQAYCALGIDGYLKVRNGNGTLLATGTNLFTLNQKVNVGMKVQVANAGRYKVVRNGVLEPGLAAASGDPLTSASDVTGADTYNDTTGSAVIGRWVWGTQAAVGLSGPWQMGAPWCVISGGTFNNDYIGDVEVVTVRPNAAGNYSQSTIVGGAATRHESVDETPADGDTTAVALGTTGTQTDTYGYEDLPVGVTEVLAVVAKVSLKTSTNINTDFVQRESATDSTAGAWAVNSATYVPRSYAFNTHPSRVGTATWAAATFNGSEFGPRKSTTGTVTVSQAVLDVLVPYQAALGEDAGIAEAGQHFPTG
jgi:hypothetical protein